MASADELIVARHGGSPVRAIAVVYSRSPLVFVAEAGSGIENPYDFVDQTILAGINSIATLHAMMAFVGIPQERYSVLTLPFDLDLFETGETAVWSVYLTGSIRVLQDAGFDLNIIHPDDYGVHFYADTIFASDEFLDTKPDLVTRFLRASLAGWQWAIANPEEAAALALHYDDALDLQTQTEQMVASIPLVLTGRNPIGWMLEGTWRGMHDMLLQQKLIGPMDVGSLYTMQFLEAIYDAK